MLIHSDPNNMNSIVYHLIIVKYSMKTLQWYFPWATALHLYNMTGTGGKLQQLHCYHPFSDSLDIYLTKNHYMNYSPKMVPIAKIWGSGSWTISHVSHITGADKGLVGCYRLHGPENYFNALTTCSSAGGCVVNVDSRTEETAVTGNSIYLECVCAR